MFGGANLYADGETRRIALRRGIGIKLTGADHA